MNPAGPPRAVLDTSVLFQVGLRRALHQSALRGAFVAIWSPWIIGELYRVLTWQGLERTQEFSQANAAACGRSAKAMMTLLIITFETVSPVPPYPPAWPTLSDMDDHPILAAAKLGGARYVVSDNTHDFPPRGQDGRHMHEGIEYVTGGGFIERLAQRSI